jgi:hypothetical protein
MSVHTNRRNGDAVDSFEAQGMGGEDEPGATSAAMLGHSSMGNGASNIDGGIIALNFITAALDLNSGHSYCALHRAQRFTTRARFS